MAALVLHSSRVGTAVSVQSIAWGDVAARVGVPFALAVIILTQLVPKIDRGIEIADHVDAELQFIAANGCSPPTRPSVTLAP